MFPPMRPSPIIPICMPIVPFRPSGPESHSLLLGIRAPGRYNRVMANDKRLPQLAARGWLWLTIALLFSAPGQAQLWVGVGAGTRGAELALGDTLAPQWGVRADVAGFDLSRNDLHVADNRYDASLRLLSGSALVDWQPFANGFRLSGGIVLDGNRATGQTVPAPDGTVTLGQARIPVALVGSLSGKLDYSPVAPALSIGWASTGRRGLGGFVDIGAFDQGRPRVTLTPEIPPGSPLNEPAARALVDTDLATEVSRIHSRVDRYRVYPLLDFGLAYRF
jgi:hypothetical protein